MLHVGQNVNVRDEEGWKDIVTWNFVKIVNFFGALKNSKFRDSDSTFWTKNESRERRELR